MVWPFGSLGLAQVLRPRLRSLPPTSLWTHLIPPTPKRSSLGTGSCKAAASVRPLPPAPSSFIPFPALSAAAGLTSCASASAFWDLPPFPTQQNSWSKQAGCPEDCWNSSTEEETLVLLPTSCPIRRPPLSAPDPRYPPSLLNPVRVRVYGGFLKAPSLPPGRSLSFEQERTGEVGGWGGVGHSCSGRVVAPGAGWLALSLL